MERVDKTEGRTQTTVIHKSGNVLFKLVSYHLDKEVHEHEVSLCMRPENWNKSRFTYLSK